MAMVISLIVSLCGQVSTTDVNAKIAELQKQHPGAKVTARFKACK